MIITENRVGRLCELRIASPVTSEEQDVLQQDLGRLFAAVKGPAILCTDIRGAVVFPEAVSERFVRMMRADNAKIERSAFLIGPSALFSLQLERFIREAANPARRCFRTAAELVAWVAPMLGAEERTRIAAFLREGD